MPRESIKCRVIEGQVYTFLTRSTFGVTEDVLGDGYSHMSLPMWGGVTMIRTRVPLAVRAKETSYRTLIR